MYGSPYKGILKGAKAVMTVGVLDGGTIIQNPSVASALNAVAGVLSSQYGMNIPMVYTYSLTHPKLDPSDGVTWIEKGDNDLFEIINGTTLRFKGTPGAGTYTCYVCSQDQDSWLVEQAIVVTVT